MSTAFGPLDELMGRLLETWEQRYDFEFDRKKRVASFSRDGMQVQVDELPSGELSVVYEHALHETTTEVCGPEEAASLIEAILSRQNLCRVPMPKGVSGATQRPWWKRIFGS